MSKILVYALEESVPTVVVKADAQILLRKTLSHNIIATIDSPINETEIEEQIYYDIQMNENEENEPLEWLDKRKRLGDYGEDIALKYLKTVYKNVRSVANQAFLGFDIEVTDNENIRAFEVKTSEHNRGFFISFNELKKAAKYRINYNVFIVYVASDTEIYGYIINDPIAYFEIDMDAIMQPKESSNAYLTPNGFYVKYKEGFFEDKKTLILSD